MPRIRDVETMLELLADLGAEVAWTERNEVRVCAADVHSTSLDEALSERIRASILLAGPLLARFGSADVPLPGGDVIGRRRVDSHLLALSALGAEVVADRTYRFRAPGGLQGHGVPPRRGLGHRHRERAHGRGAGRGHDDDPPRGLRAARAGSLPAAASRWASQHRGHRLEPAARARPGDAGRRLARRLPRSHRGRLVHRHGGGHGRRRHDHRLRAQRPARHAARVRPARRPRRDRRPRRARAARPGAARRRRRARPDRQDRRRPVARVPGRHDVGRRRGRDAGRAAPC